MKISVTMLKSNRIAVQDDVPTPSNGELGTIRSRVDCNRLAQGTSSATRDAAAALVTSFGDFFGSRALTATPGIFRDNPAALSTVG